MVVTRLVPSNLPHKASLRVLGFTRFVRSIKRGLWKERARLGTSRGFGTELTLRGFCTERARLGTFRGFDTDRARLGTFNQNFEIFTQNEHLPAQRFFS